MLQEKVFLKTKRYAKMMDRKLKLNICSESVNIDTTVVNKFVVVSLIFFGSVHLYWKKTSKLEHSNQDDKWQFSAKTQSPTRIQASNLYRIAVYSSANAVPACCTNVDFPIPTTYLSYVVSIFDVNQ